VGWNEVVLPRGTVRIGPIDGAVSPALFDLFGRVVAAGEGFPQSPPLTRADFEATWVKPVSTVVAAFVGDELAGAYYLKPNFPGRGAHIANAGYIVDRAMRGTGIGRLLIQDSIGQAATLGFDAIQFNLVFASNPARPLYEQLGWREIGRIPAAVNGEDAVIYWRAVT
jgi:GNAT superfamily N-acetyltransferase